MYIIVTDKPGEYRSEPGDGINPIESWKYIFYGQERATFTIGEVTDDAARIAIIDAADKTCVNSVPNKFFGDFDNVAAARAEIEELIQFGNIDAKLERVM
ncbi:MAG: ferredoxin [Hyphomicrobiales bacterium]|nr:ferredoxin [Hyphomicrobiales bacterium]